MPGNLPTSIVAASGNELGELKKPLGASNDRSGIIGETCCGTHKLAHQQAIDGKEEYEYKGLTR